MSNLMEIREMLANDLVTFGSYAQERADEYIEAIMQRVEKQTEQRIIKLLEDPATMSNWWAMPDKSLGLYGNLKNYVIELIKGETNE